MISRLLMKRTSRSYDTREGNSIKIIKREILLEKIRGFARQPSNFEFLFMGKIEGRVDSLSLTEKFAVWQNIGEMIEEARRLGLKVLRHGITGDGRIFLVLAK